jgi:phage repressor protein C with HTH and peptisase S24 domain
MRIAQLLPKHTAYPSVMQVAYDKSMEKPESPRRARRRAKLMELLEENGGPAQVARESGTPKSHFSALASGSRGLGDDLAKKLEGIYQKPEGWFDSGASLTSSTSATTSSSAGLTTGRVEINLENNPDYPAIRRVKFKLSAGASGFGVDYMGEDAAPIVFQRSWYEGRRLTPSKLFAIRVANGSMEPGLHDGDTVVVNTGADEPKDGVVYAVNYEGELVVKRLVRDEGSWWLSSDNPDQRRYPRKRMTEDCFVLGEIVHKQSERI